MAKHFGNLTPNGCLMTKVVGADTEKVSKEKAIASEEEKKVQVINEEV